MMGGPIAGEDQAAGLVFRPAVMHVAQAFEKAFAQALKKPRQRAERDGVSIPPGVLDALLAKRPDWVKVEAAVRGEPWRVTRLRHEGWLPVFTGLGQPEGRSVSDLVKSMQDHCIGFSAPNAHDSYWKSDHVKPARWVLWRPQEPLLPDSDGMTFREQRALVKIHDRMIRRKWGKKFRAIFPSTTDALAAVCGYVEATGEGIPSSFSARCRDRWLLVSVVGANPEQISISYGVHVGGCMAMIEYKP